MAIYMKFGTVTGDATQAHFREREKPDPGYKRPKISMEDMDQWINVSTFKWTVERSLTTRSGSQANTRDPKQPHIETFNVTKEADSATTQLLESICKATEGVTCKIVFLRTGEPGEAFMQYVFDHCFITKITLTTDREGKTVEDLDINFTKVETTFWGANIRNVSGAPNRFDFELKQTSPGSGSGQPTGGHH